MDVFGHVGLTLAAAYAADRAAQTAPIRGRSDDQVAVASSTDAGPTDSGWQRLGRLDYRLVIVGSLIPDLIDKPLGLWVATDLVSGSTRSVTHSAAFALVLLAVVALTPRPGLDLKALSLALSSAGHLVLDRMWSTTNVLLWPVKSWDFDERTSSISQYADTKFWEMVQFYTDPPELIGAIVILALAVKLWREREVLSFLRSGAVA